MAIDLNLTELLVEKAVGIADVLITAGVIYVTVKHFKKQDKKR